MAFRVRKVRYREEGVICSVCKEPFLVQIKVFETPLNTIVHTRCRRRYVAALVVYYDLTLDNVIFDLDLSVRTGYRIMETVLREF